MVKEQYRYCYTSIRERKRNTSEFSYPCVLVVCVIDRLNGSRDPGVLTKPKSFLLVTSKKGGEQTNTRRN